MQKIIACCGLVCSECEIYLATVNNDNELRAKTVVSLKEAFNVDYKPEDLNCLGCISTEGAHLDYCAVCEIRKCAQSEKRVVNCAYCSDYPCSILKEFLDKVPKARAVLDEVKAKL
jgi:hypothetical protein